MDSRERTLLAFDHKVGDRIPICGSVVDIIPEMMDCGLDVLQSCQLEANGMALSNLQSRFDKYICFQGGVSIQKTMPFGSPDDVRQEVKELADLFKSNGG
ncbi:MAG TPA: hypothetical protein DIU35_02880, partial [Candidatus Latescibacteria bacterium]|nr:hypothetical protein [Candidatus Latescibacterota bacterium]